MKHTEKWYRRRLAEHFAENFTDYEESAEYLVDPTPNQWLFDIRELGLRIELTCNDRGIVTESRTSLDRAWYGVNMSSEKANIFKDYLREHDIQFEPSSAFNQIHIECLMTEAEAEAFNKWIDETL